MIFFSNDDCVQFKICQVWAFPLERLVGRWFGLVKKITFLAGSWLRARRGTRAGGQPGARTATSCIGVQSLGNVAPQAGSRAKTIYTRRLRLRGRDWGRARPCGRFYIRPLRWVDAHLWPVGTRSLRSLGFPGSDGLRMETGHTNSTKARERVREKR